MADDDIAATQNRIGLRLAQARAEIGMTQEQVAQAIGVDRSSIANIEAGRQNVTLSVLLMFIRATGADPSRLIQPIDLWPAEAAR